GWATPDDAAQWDRLCREHEAWLEILLRRFRDPIFAAQRGAWSGDADGLGRVAEVIAAAERGERLLSPVRVAGRDDIAEMLRADPPAAAMTAGGVRRTKEALAGVDEIRAVLTGANWPLHATFERLAGRYDQLGRPALAAVLRDRLTDVSRLDRDLFQAATRLLDVAPSVKALDGLVEQVFGARARIEGALDPSCRPDVVAAVLVPHLPEPGAAVDDAAHGAIAQGLLPDMVWIDRVNTRLDAFDGVVAIDTLRTDAPSVLPTSYDDGRAIQAWLTVVGDYEVDPDAVRSLDAVRTEPGLTAIRDNLDRLRRLATTSEGDRSRIETNIETSARGLAAIESDIEAARTIPPIRRNAARIDDALRKITEAVATTRTEVTTLLAEVGNPADWRAAICATDASYRIEALNRWWIVLRDDFCGRISADDLRADTDLYVASYGRFGDWSVWLGLIDERLAVDLASLASGDRAAVARAAQAAREQAVTAILGAPDPKADPPPREDPDWLARIEAQRTALDAWVVDGASALETLASVEALLDLGYGFDDEPADGSSTVRARIDDAKAAHTTFDAMRAARPEVAARLDDLEAIAGLTATPALVERAITT
ncbi:MAG: hypothetical protein KDA25_02780, partial [Phycisphaerales bacterium]|nr:hypothetical protein [Phycisphaerales bacterium]